MELNIENRKPENEKQLVSIMDVALEIFIPYITQYRQYQSHNGQNTIMRGTVEMGVVIPIVGETCSLRILKT